MPETREKYFGICVVHPFHDQSLAKKSDPILMSVLCFDFIDLLHESQMLTSLADRFIITRVDEKSIIAKILTAFLEFSTFQILAHLAYKAP